MIQLKSLFRNGDVPKFGIVDFFENNNAMWAVQILCAAYFLGFIQLFFFFQKRRLSMYMSQAYFIVGVDRSDENQKYSNALGNSFLATCFVKMRLTQQHGG